MSTPNPFPDIPVTVAQIIRQAGHKAYQCGLAYARQREVVRYTYDEDENTLEGLVNGSTPIPYEVDIRFFPGSDADSNLFNARCTCPVTVDCKHAVALMLTALDRAKTARKALDNAPGGRIRQPMNRESPEDYRATGCGDSRRSPGGVARIRGDSFGKLAYHRTRISPPEQP